MLGVSEGIELPPPLEAAAPLEAVIGAVAIEAATGTTGGAAAAGVVGEAGVVEITGEGSDGAAAANDFDG